MKKMPVGIFMYVEDGLAKVDFSCPVCGKEYNKIVIGGKNEPTKCDCGCEFEKIRYY